MMPSVCVPLSLAAVEVCPSTISPTAAAPARHSTTASLCIAPRLHCSRTRAGQQQNKEQRKANGRTRSKRGPPRPVSGVSPWKSGCSATLRLVSEGLPWKPGNFVPEGTQNNRCNSCTGPGRWNVSCKTRFKRGPRTVSKELPWKPGCLPRPVSVLPRNPETLSGTVSDETLNRCCDRNNRTRTSSFASVALIASHRKFLRHHRKYHRHVPTVTNSRNRRRSRRRIGSTALATNYRKPQRRHITTNNKKNNSSYAIANLNQLCYRRAGQPCDGDLMMRGMMDGDDDDGGDGGGVEDAGDLTEPNSGSESNTDESNAMTCFGSDTNVPCSGPDSGDGPNMASPSALHPLMMVAGSGSGSESPQPKMPGNSSGSENDDELEVEAVPLRDSVTENDELKMASTMSLHAMARAESGLENPTLLCGSGSDNDELKVVSTVLSPTWTHHPVTVGHSGAESEDPEGVYSTTHPGGPHPSSGRADVDLEDSTELHRLEESLWLAILSKEGEGSLTQEKEDSPFVIVPDQETARSSSQANERLEEEASLSLLLIGNDKENVAQEEEEEEERGEGPAIVMDEQGICPLMVTDEGSVSSSSSIMKEDQSVSREGEDKRECRVDPLTITTEKEECVCPLVISEKERSVFPAMARDKESVCSASMTRDEDSVCPPGTVTEDEGSCPAILKGEESVWPPATVRADDGDSVCPAIIKVRVEGSVFPVERRLLASTCEYFRALFESGMRESRQPEICLQGLSARGFLVTLGILLGSRPLLSADEIVEVIEVAAFLQVQCVTEHLSDIIDSDNCMLMYHTAATYGLMDLFHSAALFIRDMYADLKGELACLPQEMVSYVESLTPSSYAMVGSHSTSTELFQDTCRTVCYLDEEDDIWRILTTLPLVASTTNAGVAVLDNKLYVVGGVADVNKTVVDAGFCYDPEADVWSVFPSPAQLRYNASLLAHQGGLYALGGEFQRKTMASVEVYWPEQRTWAPAPHLPRAAANVPCTRAMSRAFICLLRPKDATEIYELCGAGEQQRWELVTTLVRPRSYGHYLASHRHHLYVVRNGPDDDFLRCVMDSYNLATGQWSSISGHYEALSTMAVRGDSAFTLSRHATEEYGIRVPGEREHGEERWSSRKARKGFPRVGTMWTFLLRLPRRERPPLERELPSGRQELRRHRRRTSEDQASCLQ
ncbi:uncharacterized protein kbtbd13a [Engraulis encrasicolus]|uniref:uncharacterized protein kbtbd13a n=1 Tax=Engraulis encrasicolus TaxID=184585 RepID=UPI002FD0E4B7